MTIDDFNQTQTDWCRKADLTDTEKESIDALGFALLHKDGLATNFESWIEKCGSPDGAGLLQNWDNLAGSHVKCSLYTPMQEGGFERMPQINFQYWNNLPDGKKETILDITFIPGFVAGLGYGSEMRPYIRVAPRDSSGDFVTRDDIHCSITKNVIEYVIKNNAEFNAHRKPSGPKDSFDHD